MFLRQHARPISPVSIPSSLFRVGVSRLPTMSTRNSSKLAFDHVMDVVLERDSTSPLKRALLKHGYDDIHSIYSLNDEDMNFLTYDEPGGSFAVPILSLDKVLISTFLDFVIHKDNVNDPVGSGWINITREEFDKFRTSTSNSITTPVTTSTTSLAVFRPTNTFPPPSAKPLSASKPFAQNEITRDLTLFPALKDEKLQQPCPSSPDNQDRYKVAVGMTDPSYKSTAPAVKHACAMMQFFMCTVVLCTVIDSHHQSPIAGSHAIKHPMVRVFSTSFGDQESRDIIVTSLAHCIQQTNKLVERCLLQWEFRLLWDPGIKQQRGIFKDLNPPFFSTTGLLGRIELYLDETKCRC